MPLYPNITVKLTGTNGNAFSVLGNVNRALTQNKVPEDKRKEFLAEATKGDYDNVLQTCMKWVNVE
jgi:hypothetical protein